MTSENNERAKRFQTALCNHGDDWGHRSKLIDRADLIDLLGAARHWCDRHELSFADLDRMAYERYLLQLAEEKQSDGRAS